MGPDLYGKHRLELQITPHLAGARRQQEYRVPEVGDRRAPLCEHHGVGREKIVRGALNHPQPCLTKHEQNRGKMYGAETG